MPRLLVVDDHELVRKGLKYFLEGSDEPIEVDEASSGSQALRRVQNEKPFDLVVLDISLPGEDGIEILKQIKKLCPSLPVLILTMHPEDQYGVRALRAGASGYITKNSTPEDTRKAVRTVLRGGQHVGPGLTENLVREVATCGRARHHHALSNREFDVLRRIAKGEKPAEIGSALRITSKTVQTHRSRILQKLDVKTTAELVLYAVKHGLVD